VQTKTVLPVEVKDCDLPTIGMISYLLLFYRFAGSQAINPADPAAIRPRPPS